MSYYDPRERELSRPRRLILHMFPERHFMLRSEGRMRSVRMGTAWQIVGVCLLVAFFGWISFSSYMFINHQSILAGKNEDIHNSRSAYKALLAQVGVYRDRISEVTENLERNHAQALALLERNAALDAVLREEEQGLPPLEDLVIADIVLDEMDSLYLLRERAARERASLRERLAQLEQELAAPPEQVSLEGTLESIEVELRKVTLQRDLAKAESDDLRAQVAELRASVEEMENTQLALFQRFSTIARDRVREIEESLSNTGLDIGRLLETHQEGQRGEQGGPFIPLDLGAWVGGALERSLSSLNDQMEHLNALESLATLLPIGEPMSDYRLTSGFGPRRDPFTNRIAMHQGLDFGGDLNATIRATARGRVVFAGWRGHYGRMVEIDHGNGIKTRYAHLSSLRVGRGDLVDRETIIGTMGASGRATGPHLHYEVWVDGIAVDPHLFLKAGIDVFKS